VKPRVAELFSVFADHLPDRVLADAALEDASGLVQRQYRAVDEAGLSSHSSIMTFTQAGTGTVHSRLPLPARSGMTQRESRSWMSSKSKETSSARRKPQPISSARIARSRQPMSVERSGAFSSAVASSARSASFLPACPSA
jgi:hypothetical protein